MLPPVVHPNSQFRRHWDAFTAFFALCALWQLPLGLVVSWWPSSPLGAFESSAAARLLNLWLDAWCVWSARAVGGGVLTPPNHTQDAARFL